MASESQSIPKQSECRRRYSVGALRYQTYAPKGVHVAHVVIDGVIESPNTKAWATKARFGRMSAMALKLQIGRGVSV